MLHYKRGKVSAEGRASELKSEVEEWRGASAAAAAAAAAAVASGEEGAAAEENASAAASVAGQKAGEKAPTRATGVNTEEVRGNGGGGIGWVALREGTLCEAVLSVVSTTIHVYFWRGPSFLALP